MALEQAAVHALSTWSRPQLPYAQWWAELKPLLSDNARTMYADTDPSVVLALKIRDATDVDTLSAYTATLRLATDHGSYGVDLSRASATSPWLVETILFPGEESKIQ